MLNASRHDSSAGLAKGNVRKENRVRKNRISKTDSDGPRPLVVASLVENSA